MTSEELYRRETGQEGYFVVDPVDYPGAFGKTQQYCSWLEEKLDELLAKQTEET